VSAIKDIPERKMDFTMLAKTGLSPRHSKAGELIFDEGDSGARMYVVRSGEVEIRCGDLVVETLQTGGMFGEMALIDGTHRSASAWAKTDCELIPVDEETFLFLVRETPYFALDVMRTLTRRLRSMNDLV